jgi:hypothetical protein
MEHRWNEINMGKPKYSGKNLSQCHFVHRKSHMDWPGIGGRRLTAWAMARPSVIGLMPPVYTCWYCTGVLCFQQPVQCNFMKNIRNCPNSLLGIWVVWRRHAPLVERKGEVDITNNLQQNLLRVHFEYYEPAFKSHKYLSTSVRSDKALVPAGLFVSRWRPWCRFWHLHVKWEHNHFCAT